jgi:hypothetical protein
MADRDFTMFDQAVDAIIDGIDGTDREAVKRRINLELDQIESEVGSVLHRMCIETRRRIRAIERKALARLGDRVTPPLEQGRQCTLCAQYESDVRVISLGNVHAVCAECITLVKEIVDEDKNGGRR